MFAAAVPVIIVGVGSVGYHLIEEWGYFDALYMTVITLATVGYGETHPLSQAGRAFTMVLILGGAFTMAAAVTSVIRSIVSGEVQRLVGRQRMERFLNSLNSHVIVCGYGRMGRIICDELSQAHQPFVVIDRNHELIEHFPSRIGVALEGDATADEVLRKAGIERARALVSAVPHDADNLFITLSAKLLNDRIFVVARAEDPASEVKLTRAGANRVVAPYLLGGSRVVQAVLRPSVLDFIDLATRTQHIELQMEETFVREGSVLIGKKLSESMTREHRIIVVAIKRQSGAMEFNPGGATVLEQGDTLISLGHRHDLDRLERLARPA
ncbi:MAG: hypothetical protein A2138_14415 [Deltaproteobacteria bacterium RBG_16_71_12]|nr:MAG: hypothetical protein A2138_14415 [Deltaproteobacteria bacterium RBG_16_71_12]